MKLGPYWLESLMKRTAFGEIWRGRYHAHHGHGERDAATLAIKISHHERALENPQHAASALAGNNEVRAIARLSHPSIVNVFDCGQIEEVLESGDGHQLPVGAPYLVMELADGSLDDHCGQMHWSQVVRVLLSLLDALAHAHARGVIHRDIKPSNILLFDGAAKLADFGIAHALIRDEDEGDADKPSIQGTPAYMAPEQFSGDDKLFGPWTDLYALGCAAYALLVGTPPFGEGNHLVCMAAHLSEPVPELPERVGLPDEIALWLKTLLAKQPQDRFQRAADAAWHLIRLCERHPVARTALQSCMEEPEVGHGASSDSLDALDTVSQVASVDAPRVNGRLTGEIRTPSLRVFRTLVTGSFHAFRVPSQETLSAVGEDAPIAAKTLQTPAPSLVRAKRFRPPVHGALWGSGDIPPWSSWERDDATDATHAHAFGFRLFGLRELPLVDRREERTALWDTLGHVWREGRAACAIVSGAAGIGKSHLLRWFCERTHELGLATPISGVHFSTPGHIEGIGDALARYLRCRELQGEALRAHVAARCEREGLTDAALIHAIAELIQPSSSQERQGQAHPIRFASPQERFSVLLSFLRACCANRPVILWFDDVQWGVDALACAQFIMKQQDRQPLPLLLLLSYQDEGLVERPLSRQFLDTLGELEDVCSLGLSPLQEPAWSQLIQEQLGLSGRWAREVAERAAGNPMFAVQLVGDWIQRGIFVTDVTETEARLSRDVRSEEVEIVLPDSLFQVWERRTKRLLSVWPQGARIALELAAALGTHVSFYEWELACGIAEISCPHRLVDVMVQQGLATSTASDWTFAHNVFRESIERSARNEKRWSLHHEICAEVLSSLPPSMSHDSRLGRHLFHAGRPEAAMAPLCNTISSLLQQAELQSAEAFLHLVQRVLEAASLPAQDPQRGEFCLLQSRFFIMRSQYEEAAVWAQDALFDAELHSWPSIRCRALIELTRCSWKEGDIPTTKELFQTALSQAEEIQEQQLLAKIHLEMGHWYTSLGQLEVASMHLLEAQIAAVAIDDTTSLAKSYRHLGEIARQEGQLEQALRYVQKAKGFFSSHGLREEMAQALNLHGEIMRYQRDFASAEALYREAIDVLQNADSGLKPIFELNLGLTLIQRQMFIQAQAVLEQSLIHYVTQEHKIYTAIVKLLILPCLAHQKDWERWDDFLREASQTCSQVGLYDVDLAEMAQLAGHIAIQGGKILRARRAFSLALEQWEALQRPDEAIVIRTLLGTET